jgi:hypothetical protein
MRKIFVWIVALEGAALSAAGLLLLFGLEDRAVRAPSVPEFRPPVHQSVIGDQVRYEKLGRETGKMLGYLEWRVLRAMEIRNTTVGREFILEIIEVDAQKQRRSRTLRVLPRSSVHGFLPPIFDEEARDSIPGSRPVVKSIRTAPVPLLKREVPGFLLEAIIPRDSLTDVAERYWITPQVPIFGVAKWETKHAVYKVLTMEKLAP